MTVNVFVHVVFEVMGEYVKYKTAQKFQTCVIQMVAYAGLILTETSAYAGVLMDTEVSWSCLPSHLIWK